MAIFVYNTLTRRKEELIPRSASRIGIYICGITPYSKSHIGHARPSIFWDVVRRYLEYKGYSVTVVQNFTDIDDKIIQAANKANVDPLNLAQKFSDEYLRSMDSLGVTRADYYPRASQHIQDIIQMIDVLVTKGYAYESDGDVYFDVSKFEGYGKLSKRSLDEMRAGARVEPSEKKDDPMDFALWKAAKPGEPFWNSPWGPGRPGWHIECSAMSLKYLGHGFEMHGGGTELIFPHHENEVAQSEAYAGRAPFVKYWVHNELLNFSGEKMSKSIGNIVTIEEVLEKYPPEAVRLFMLSAHYRKPLDFEESLLESAEKGWQRLTETLKTLGSTLRARKAFGTDRDSHEQTKPGDLRLAESRSEFRRGISLYRQAFENAMDDDFNTAQAIGHLFELSRFVNHAIHKEGIGTEPSDVKLLEQAHDAMIFMGGILGVLNPEPGSTAKEEELDKLVRFVLDIRESARKRKDWALADDIRDGLLGLGYKVEDTPNGPRWKRI